MAHPDYIVTKELTGEHVRLPNQHDFEPGTKFRILKSRQFNGVYLSAECIAAKELDVEYKQNAWIFDREEFMASTKKMSTPFTYRGVRIVRPESMSTSAAKRIIDKCRGDYCMTVQDVVDLVQHEVEIVNREKEKLFN